MPLRKKKPGEDDKDTEKRTTTIIMALPTAVQACGHTLHLDKDEQALLYEELLRCVHAQSRITVLAAWFLNVYFAWLTDDQIATQGAAAGTHALLTCAASLVNNTGNLLTARSQPLMKQCFDTVFAPRFPDSVWPRLDDGGHYASAIGRLFDANYQVYTTLALDAHAISYLRLEGAFPPDAYVDGRCPEDSRLPKWVATKAWERAKKLWPATTDASFMTTQWHRDYNANRPLAYVDVLAERMVVTMRTDPLLLHRDILRRVEERQAAAMDVDGEDTEARYRRTGKTFSLFPIYKIRSHFGVLDQANTFLPDHDSAGVLRSLFPKRPGWEPAHQIMTDGVRVALTYTRMQPKRTIGSDAMRKRKRRSTLGEHITERPAHSSFHADLDAPLIDIRTAPKGMYDLKDLQEDWTFADGDWEAFDPGLTHLFTGNTPFPKTAILDRSSPSTASAIRDRIFWCLIYDVNRCWPHHVWPKWAQRLVQWPIHTSRCCSSVSRSAVFRDARDRSVNWARTSRLRWLARRVAVPAPVRCRHSFLDIDVPRSPSSMKGMPPAPVTKVRDYLARHGRVVIVDEFRTSKVYFKTLTLLTPLGRSVRCVIARCGSRLLVLRPSTAKVTTTLGRGTGTTTRRVTSPRYSGASLWAWTVRLRCAALRPRGHNPFIFKFESLQAKDRWLSLDDGVCNDFMPVWTKVRFVCVLVNSFADYVVWEIVDCFVECSFLINFVLRGIQTKHRSRLEREPPRAHRQSTTTRRQAQETDGKKARTCSRSAQRCQREARRRGQSPA